MPTTTLKKLLSPWVTVSDVSEISDLTVDSRIVSSGYLFVAIKGHALDGRDYISAAIKAGASAVIADADEKHPHASMVTQDGINIVYIEMINEKLSALAGRFYLAETRKMKLIGITGTNGKTTISQIIAQWATLLGQRAGVMGTTGNGLLDNLKPAQNTTGNAIEIQQTLFELEQEGAQLTALEVSSHGLVQGRIKSLLFSTAVFTNLSRDHLDYHGDMTQYGLAKKSLFTEHQCSEAIINADDPVGYQWLTELPSAVAVSVEQRDLSGLKGKKLWAKSVQYSTKGIKLVIDSSWGPAQFNVPLIGAFNASNVLLAMATLLTQGFSMQQLIDTAPKLSAVIGRMELFQLIGSNSAPKIVVDYAHTPDALEKALLALRVHCKGKLWCLVGCGGARDVGKRPMMAEIAERLADHVILTDDNPRTEDPKRIIDDMLAGVINPNAISVEHNRFEACQLALKGASADDIILLAGKGHEDYQVFASGNVHYSDRETAARLLQEITS
ncbi:MAG: UDP-N-acetylmuramoyl-L-alanyl-D-glutamate--2,6-diaminopimelate ligase [Aliivibrio sp.]|uniref:UDP-N-acetylmuramoyl-L-alanyl-D-glutamate--2, 6-diaminopimelate ligase n=1 Tax=Aliivibrio sp. TaxID=1872443 RepID=UPI001A3DBC84|nr:UDP-N-acetylmuramoyl-L-alanyl-D-glutamate--2,6-diaminopimelate ligase [Aliivibrio sp.]